MVNMDAFNREDLQRKPCKVCGKDEVSKKNIYWQKWMCNPCLRDHQKEYRDKNKEKLKEQRKARYAQKKIDYEKWLDQKVTVYRDCTKRTAKEIYAELKEKKEQGRLK